MQRSLSDPLSYDPFAYQLWEQAEQQFSGSAKDRDRMRSIKLAAAQFAESFVDHLFKVGLSPTAADQLRRELSALQIERPIKDVPDDFLKFYRDLGVIEDFTRKAILLAFPAKAVQPLILHACPPENLIVPEMDLLKKLAKAREAVGIDQNKLSFLLLSESTRLLKDLLIPGEAIGALDVYLGGPQFYSLAGTEYSLTFATGSGLPNPLEWNGSIWFSQQYGVGFDELKQYELHRKHPLRSVNFALGICYHEWRSKRIYVWQGSKTSNDLKTARKIATAAGSGQKFLKDAYKQLVQTFLTPNLLILELDEFPNELKLWTRVSHNQVMLSARPGTPEAQIGHGIWLRPGFHFSDATIEGLKTVGQVSFGASGAGALVSSLGADKSLGIEQLPLILSALATGFLAFFAAKALKDKRRLASIRFQEMLQSIQGALDFIWDSPRSPPGLVKEPGSYGKNSSGAAIATLARLLGEDPRELKADLDINAVP